MSGTVCIFPDCPTPDAPAHSHPRADGADPQPLGPLVEDQRAVVTVGDISVPIEVRSDKRWMISMSGLNGQLPAGVDPNRLARPHRDKQAAVTAAGMLAVDLERAKRAGERIRQDVVASLAAYAWVEPDQRRVL